MDVSEIIKKKNYEKIIFILHRHPLTFIPILFLFIILLLVPVAVFFLINNIYPTLLFKAPIFQIAVLLGSIYYLSTYLFFYAHFIDFYLDLWIVTNDRIVDIEQHNLFSRTITELDLFRIQDVTTDITGMFPTIFNYGNVTIKTASSNKNIIFFNVSNPNHIREQLIHLADEDRKYHMGHN